MKTRWIRKASVKTALVPAEIRTEHLPSASLGRYLYANLLGEYISCYLGGAQQSMSNRATGYRRISFRNAIVVEENEEVHGLTGRKPLIKFVHVSTSSPFMPRDKWIQFRLCTQIYPVALLTSAVSQSCNVLLTHQSTEETACTWCLSIENWEFSPHGVFVFR